MLLYEIARPFNVFISRETNMSARARKSGESFPAYRKNLKREQRRERERKPVLLWNSGRRGTYVRKLHGELTSV